MISRRDLMRLGGVAALGAVAGCDERPAPAGPGAVVYADTTGGFAALDTTTGRVATESAPIVAGPGWPALATSSVSGESTAVVLRSPAGLVVGRLGVTGRYAV